MNERPVLNYEQAAQYLGVSPRMIGRLVAAGRLPKVRHLGRRVLIPRAALDAFCRETTASQ